MEVPAADSVPARRAFGGYEVLGALGLLAGLWVLGAGLYEMGTHPEHRFPGFDPLVSANAQAARGDARGAVREYALAAPILRRDATVPRQLADTLAQLGDLPGEIEARRRVVALAPRSRAAHLALGASLLKAGRHAEAMAAYRQALVLAPGDAGAHNGLAVALAGQGRLLEARDEFRAAARSSEDPAILANLQRVEAELAAGAP